MKVKNMTNNRGNKVPNQFIIEDLGASYVQSYDTIIVKKVNDKVYLDKNKWDCSVTTSKHRNIYLNETTKETRAKIASGEYELIDLNT